jgi:hypothetical protein
MENIRIRELPTRAEFARNRPGRLLARVAISFILGNHKLTEGRLIPYHEYMLPLCKNYSRGVHLYDEVNSA